MKKIIFLRTLLSINLLLALVIILPTKAQVTSDGTTNTNINQNGNNFEITNGIQRGNNLFHSFQEFSIPTGSSATFNNSTDVVNIINRVTGGNISNIDGLIQANGNANLFLINPAGIVFSENASLNIGGSFLGSTAESVLFENGFEFSAVNPKNEPLLTVSVPLGLQMGSNPGKIEVQGSGHQITWDTQTNTFNRDAKPLGLQVPFGKTLALIGGDISLQGGNITAEGGRIELGSVLESAKVKLILTSDGFTTGYDDVSKFGDINLSQAASVEVSGEGAGNLQLQGRKISLVEESLIIADTLGKENGGLFSVKASELLEIIGGGTSNIFTGFITGVEVDGTGNAGNTIIETPQLSLMTEGSLISSATVGSGDAGNINLKVDTLTLRDGPYIQTSTYASGNAGDLNLVATKSVDIGRLSNDDFFSYLASFAVRGSSGDAGKLNIITPRLSLLQGFIYASTSGSGNAGDITLELDSLNMRGDGYGSVIAAGTFAGGNGGNLTINAANSIEIVGVENNNFSTGLFSTVEPGSSGDAGNLNITTPKLNLLGSARIGTRTSESGNAGNVILKVDNLTIRDGSRITTGTAAGGSAGDLNIVATESIDISGFTTSFEGNIRRSGLFSNGERESIGDAGSLNINSNQINVRDKAIISVSNLGSGNTGNLNLNADNILLDNQATLEAETISGNQGNINLNSQFIQLRRNSNITTNAREKANGGNITINSPVIAGFENSDIIANAVEGNGGNINITTQGIFGLKLREELTPASDITASSEFGINGTVQIDNVGIEPNSGLVELPELINTDVVIANSCVARSHRESSTFHITGKQGFPYTPGEAVPSDYSMFEIRKLSLSDDNSSKISISQTRKNNSIVQATGIYRLDNGDMVIARECKK